MLLHISLRTPQNFAPMRSLAILLAVVMLSGIAAAQSCGDCDCDSDIDIIDSLRSAQFAAGIGAPLPPQTVKCDVNASTTITVLDSLFIAQVSAGITVVLVCPGGGNGPPTASLCMNTSNMGDIPITYQISDAESDTCSIEARYSTDYGVTFPGVCTQQPIGSDGTTGLTSSIVGTPHTYVWDSVADLGLVNVVGVAVRITPMDAQPGFSCRTASFTLANLPGAVPPSATACTATAAACGGLVTVNYTLIDMDSPTVDIMVEYSTNGGMGFLPSPTEGPGSQGTTGLTASAAGIAHVFVWDSSVNLPAALHSNVRVRITPMDPVPGTFCVTPIFAIDLRLPPARPGTTGTYGAPAMGTLDVWVITDPGAMAISGASVMVGLASGSPFAGNTGTTDASGHIRFCDPALMGASTVSAGAPNRQYVTFVNTTASQVVIGLKTINTFPMLTEVGGQMTGVAVPVCAAFGTPLIGAGLAMPQISASDLLSGFLGFLLGPTDCWQSGSTLTGNIALPGNVYIPMQTIPLPFCTTTLSEHRYRLNLPSSTSQRLIGLFGRIDALTAAGAATAADLVNGFDLREVAITSSFLVAPTGPQTQIIPRTGALTQNVNMTISGVPMGMDSFGITSGDLTGSNGDGPMAVMGARIASYDDLAIGPVVLNLTTAMPAALGGTVGYVSMATALFIDNPAPPPGIAGAITAVIKRDGGFSGTGGSFTLNTFFGAPTQTLPPSIPGVFNHSNPSIAPPDIVDLCLHRFERVISDPPMAIPPCMGQNQATRSTTLWEFYSPGSSTSFTMPTLPASFPRAADAGLIDPAITPEDDLINWNSAFIGIGGTGLPTAPAFSYNSFRVADLPLGVTHLAANATTIP